MKRALFAAALAVAACNQRDRAAEAPPAKAPAPAPVAKAPAPPDAPEVYHVEIEPPPDAAVAVAKPPPRSASSDDAKRLQDEAIRYADMLTADDGSGNGDLDTKRRPGADLAQQIEDAKDSGKSVAVGGGVRAGGPGMIGTAGGSDAVAAKDDTPRGRISIADKQAVDETTLTDDMVLAKVMSAYMAGLHRCYRDALHADPSKRGKLIVSFTVNETGRTVHAAVNGFDDQVDACVTSLLAGWRFAVPKDEDGEATTAGFKLTFQLVPD